MPQQNKTKSTANSRVQELENDLLLKAAQQNLSDKGTGQRTIETNFKKRVRASENVFQAKQGFRRRHPRDVLNKFTGIVTTTDNASTVVESAIEHEHERVDIPKETRPNASSQALTTMYHLDDIATQNFKNSKKKLKLMTHMINV